MSGEWLGLVLLAAVLAGLLWNKPADAVLVGALILASLLGLVRPAEAFAGFSNAGMLTVAALYVVAAGLRETGALDSLGRLAFGGAKSERGVLARMAAAVPVMSAFMNNTPIVAMLIPVIEGWCKKNRVSPSRLLIPLSYLCILGGTCTLIGTSTNLVVAGLMKESVTANPSLAPALEPLSFFELGRVGLPYAVVGIAYLMLVGPRLLPARKPFLDQLSESRRDYLLNMRAEPHCPLVGQRVDDAGLRNLPGLFLIEIQRGGESIAPVTPENRIQAGDVLVFTGVVTTIVDLKRIPGLTPEGDDGYVAEGAAQRERRLVEVVLSRTASCLGKTVRDAQFRAVYNAAIVAVHRGGERLEGKIGDFELRAGDTLLMQTGPHFAEAYRNRSDFLLVSGVDEYRPVRYDKAATALALLAALAVLMATGMLEIVVAAFLVAGLMVASRCISLSDARRHVDWSTLITIAAAFGVGKALDNSGLVERFAEGLVSVAGPLGPYGVLLAIYLTTTVFTELVTNNAAAALIFPFAVASAAQIGASPRPFVLAVAFAASASFITPLGYQTNLMVQGPGGYRYSDFVRIGLPLNLLLLTCAMVLIPMAWPF